MSKLTVSDTRSTLRLGTLAAFVDAELKLLNLIRLGPPDRLKADSTPGTLEVAIDHTPGQRSEAAVLLILAADHAGDPITHKQENTA